MSPPPIFRTPAQAVPIRLPSQEPMQSFKNQTCHRVRHQLYYKAHLPFLQKVKKSNARLQLKRHWSGTLWQAGPEFTVKVSVAKVGPMPARLSQLDFKRVPLNNTPHGLFGRHSSLAAHKWPMWCRHVAYVLPMCGRRQFNHSDIGTRPSALISRSRIVCCLGGTQRWLSRLSQRVADICKEPCRRRYMTVTLVW